MAIDQLAQAYFNTFYTNFLNFSLKSVLKKVSKKVESLEHLYYYSKVCLKR